MSKRLAYWISSIVLVIILLGAAYFVSTLYLQKQVERTLNEAIAKTKLDYPAISNITYHNVDVSPFSLWTHHYQINGVVITPQDATYQVNIKHIRIRHYTLGSDQVPTEMAVQLCDISAPQLTKTLLSLTGVSPTQTFWKNQLNALHLNMMFNYQRTTKTLTLKIALKRHDDLWIRYQAVIAQFVINTPLQARAFTDALPEILNKAYLLSANSDINVHLNPNSAVLAKQVPQLSEPLNLLGYNALDVSITGTGSYSTTTQATITNLAFALKNAGVLSVYSKEIQTTPVTLGALVNLFSTSMNNTPKNVPLLGELRIQYQDQGLFNHLLTIYAAQTQQPAAQLQMELATLLTVLPQIQQVPLAKQAAAEVASFIEKPGTLTLALKPNSPINVAQVLQDYQHALENTPTFTTAKTSTVVMSSTEKQKLIQRYQSRMTNNMLKKLGFSLTAS